MALMGITEKRAMTESLSPAERKVCKRIRKPPRSLQKRFWRLPCVIKVFSKRPLMRQFGWYHGDVFVPMSFMAGMEAFLI